MRAPFVTRPLWSWPVAVALALFGILATGVAVRARSTEGRLRIEALAVPETQPERLPEERAPLHVPAYRVVASYEIASHLGREIGSLEARYTTATVDVDACAIVLGAPRSTSEEAKGERLRFDVVMPDASSWPRRAPESVRLSLRQHRGECDDSLQRDLARETARLGAWLAGGQHGRFEGRVGSTWPGVPLGALMALATLLLVAGMHGYMTEVAVVTEPDGNIPRVRVAERLGPFFRARAELLPAEIVRVRLAGASLGPLAVHRPVLTLAGGRELPLWPLPRAGLSAALAVRDAVQREVDELRQANAPATYRSPALR